ncbi:MAG: hypothetical protein WC364_01785 [Eubacteriales bacterium]|jgi:hypothetical protein
MVNNATYVKITLIPDTNLEYNLYPKKKQLNQKNFKQKTPGKFPGGANQIIRLEGGFKPGQKIKS